MERSDNRRGAAVRCARCGKETFNAAGICDDCLGRPERSDEKPSELFCPACGERNVGSAPFCTNCGLDLTPPETEATAGPCPNCGNVTRPGDRFCTRCGLGLHYPQTQQSAEREPEEAENAAPERRSGRRPPFLMVYAGPGMMRRQNEFQTVYAGPGMMPGPRPLAADGETDEQKVMRLWSNVPFPKNEEPDGNGETGEQ